MNPFPANLACLQERYPTLADRVRSFPNSERIIAARAADGGMFLALREPNGLVALTNRVNPLESIQRLYNEQAAHIQNHTRPLFVLGLNPGDEVLALFDACENIATPHCPQPLWLCLDSTPALIGFLRARDATRLIRSPRVRLFWHEDAPRQAAWLRDHPEFPHLFTLLSAAPPATLDRVMPPFAQLILERDRLTAEWKRENADYYAALDDETLARIIEGKAGRPPRLLMPTCSWSTFIQHSTRDTCAAFESLGWQALPLKMDAMLTPFHLVQSIRDFKPDVFLFIDHLRYEAEEVYPPDMMFVCWIQDEMNHLLCREAGEKMAAYARARKRDLVVGYLHPDMTRRHGYPPDRLVPLPILADPRVFHPVTLTPAQQRAYSCDLAFVSNVSLETSQLLDEIILPQTRGLGLPDDEIRALHDRLWQAYRNGKTFCERSAFCSEMLALPAIRSAWERLLREKQEDTLLRLLYWRLNDSIYRHVVLEWAHQAGLNLHLYGHGWEKHPVFRKYACGVLPHGPELNAAYQAARYNLHLNITQGMHQRVWEILAASGRLLFRAREPAPPNEPPRSALIPCARALLAGLPPDQAIPLHDPALGEWLFHIALTLAQNSSGLSPEALETQVAELVQTHLLQRPDLLLDDWDSRTFHDQASLAALVNIS